MNELFEEIEEDFLLYGVQTTIYDETKFIFLLNKIFDWSLIRITDLDVTKNSQTYCYSNFLYENRHNIDDYVYVIKNNSHKIDESLIMGSLFDVTTVSKSDLLLRKHKIFQYFIKLPEQVANLDLNNLPLSSFKFIQTIKPIDEITKKEKKYFLI